MTGLSPDQESLVGLAADVFSRRTSNDELAEVEQSADRVDDRLWVECADAGLLGIAVPEAHGGAGLGLTELLLVLEQQGRRLAPLPLWETALLGAGTLQRLGTAQQRDDWLPRVAAGGARLTSSIDLTGERAHVHAVGESVDGNALTVPHGHVADAVIVESDDDALFLVSMAADGVVRSVVETTTHALAADLTFSAAPAPRLGDSPGEAAGWLRDAARLGLAALQLGVADEGVREAAAYVSGREQFGRPLATFQAVSQQIADAYCSVQAMRMTLWQAVWRFEQGADARAAVDVATWWATDAGLRIQHVVQHVHGGMGADTTYPVHRRLLWAMRIDALLGGPSRQLARLGPTIAAT